MLFRPFMYIDNDHSYILCNKDKIRYELGPNVIFAIDKKLDPFNDAKARKLCEHQIIRDYINSYPVPEKINYTFLPQKLQESSWLGALFSAILTFAVGSFLIGKHLWNLFLYLIE
ncbi:hypothetical protein HYW87_01190 [Candidatus Roizmanbacteria bacterium]|nr:hypothetical protein [Candidatus Roizmanbacteria bacterium]